jgi:hypothetical protein
MMVPRSLKITPGNTSEMALAVSVGAVIGWRYSPDDKCLESTQEKVVRFRPGLKVKVISENGEWLANVEWVGAKTYILRSLA